MPCRTLAELYPSALDAKAPTFTQHLADPNHKGVTFSATLIADGSSNFHGGLNTSGSTIRHLFDANLTFDLHTLAGLEGATLFIDFYTQEGDDASANDVGDFQAFSNIDADDVTQVAEFWWLQQISDSLSIKIGKMDANVDFNITDHGGEFISSSPGFSPTIQSFVSYPDTAMGVVILYQPAPDWYTHFGLYDGSIQESVPTGKLGPKSAFHNPADLFLIGEVGRTWDGGRLGVGAWAHTGTFDRFDGGTEDGAEGFYLTYDQTLWKENPNDDEDEQGIGMFMQYGWADADVSDAEHHIGAGLQWVGPLNGRDDDVTGVMVSHVLFTDETGAGYADDSETAVEAFYKIQFNEYLSIRRRHDARRVVVLKRTLKHERLQGNTRIALNSFSDNHQHVFGPPPYSRSSTGKDRGC
ncbi:MAG: carbohydrate porin [Planctomycetota bacterium]